MKRSTKLACFAVVGLIAVGVLAGCSKPTTTLNLRPVPAATTSTSEFKVDSVSVNPSEVNAGVQALITAKVTNTGAADAAYTSRVKINDVAGRTLPSYLSSQQVTIPAGTSQIVSVTTSIKNPGIYQVTWDGVSKLLVVNDEPTVVSGGSLSAATVPAPDFTAVDVVTGKTVTLQQFAGKVVLLNFVNYGCSPSLNSVVSAQLLAIRQLYQQRTDFVPVSVFCGCCPPEVLRQFAKDNNLNWPWILDTDNSIVTKYSSYLRNYGYPTLVFIDKNQMITEVTGAVSQSDLSGKLDKITTSVAEAQ